MSEWVSWIGREETRRDRVDGALAARWLATLDRDAPAGGVMPQGFHFCLCTPDAPTAALGEDGHPRRDASPDSFLPPVPLPRRMWASSKMEFLVPLKLNEAVERRSRVLSVTAKQGGSGRLVFVEVEHETSGESGPAVREVQSLVYREAVPAGSPPAPPPPGDGQFDATDWDVHRSLVPMPPLLFRYSALTFNTHRIHYDLTYATAAEGYRGLIVHGPLMATMLLDLARQQLGDNALKHFAFRGMTPGVCEETLHLVMRGSADAFELGAFASDGRHVMSATARA
jgi:3-methylfumaryl-CoA hydratase